MLLNAGGYLAIADLYEEDGSFHGERFNGHNGFDPENLAEILRKNRFRNISHRSCFKIERIISETETRQFEVFLLTANPEINNYTGSLVKIDYNPIAQT